MPTPHTPKRATRHTEDTNTTPSKHGIPLQRTLCLKPRLTRRPNFLNHLHQGTSPLDLTLQKDDTREKCCRTNWRESTVKRRCTPPHAAPPKETKANTPKEKKDAEGQWPKNSCTRYGLPAGSGAGHRERRRRCGAPGWRTRLPTPQCRPAPTDPKPAIDGGTLTVGLVRIRTAAAALLFVSSLWTPDPHNPPTMCSGYHSGALEGGQGRESGSTSGPAATPPRGWGHSHMGVSP